MFENEEKELEVINLEIKSRKVILKKLDSVFNKLKKQAEAKYLKRKAKVQLAYEYASIEEAHTAYGYDYITEKEYNEIVKIFEQGEKFVENRLSPQEVAVKILGEFISRLNYEIRSFEFDLLSPQEQMRILNQRQNIVKNLSK